MPKKLLYCSNPTVWGATGFSKHAKTLLLELYRRGYEIVEYCASLSEIDPILKKTPWKTYGCVPNNQPLLDRLKAEGNLQALQFIYHGSYFIDEIIRKEKPDVVIFTEDIWQVDQWTTTKPWWNKIPCVLWTPIDSLPLLPTFDSIKDKLQNLWVKAPFAQRALNELGIKAELLPALFDINNYHPLPTAERNNIRRVSGLQDEFVIGFVFRNQLRKLVLSLLEGFKKFKEKNPEAKTKLLLHTNWDEAGGHGWRINEAVHNIGVNPNDVLTTYVCNNCRKIAVIPYKGQGLNCAGCGKEKGLNNPTISLGVSEEELNGIYNMMDCYIHLATSGGFELPMAEAMLAGLPTATCDYAFGETFVRSGHCQPIEFDFFREGVSQFLKSQPRVESVADVITDMYKNRQKYREIGLNGREWVLEEFNHTKIIDKVAKFIDESSHDFDFKWEDPNNPLTIKDFIVESDKPRLLYVIPESADGCFISLPILETLNSTYPDYDMYVACHEQYFEIFNHLPYVKKLVPYHPVMEDFKALEGCKGKETLFDIVFHPHATTMRHPTFHHNGLDRNQLQCQI